MALGKTCENLHMHFVVVDKLVLHYFLTFKNY